MAKKLPKGITQRSDGRYMGRFTYCGERYTLYNTDVKKLQKAMNDMRYELEHGIAGDMSEISLNKWYEIWMSECKKNTVRPSTLNHFETYYNCYIRKKIGKIDVHDIKLLHIQRLYNKMGEEGYKENTIKKVNNILHNMFLYAMRNNLINKNPCDGVLIPKTQKKERRVLTKEEQTRFLAFVSNDNHYAKYSALFMLGFGSGMRIGELLALNWEDIDFDEKTIHVRRTMVYLPTDDGMKFKMQLPKTNNSLRDIPLLDNLENVLKRHYIEQKKGRLKLGEKWQPLKDDGFENLVFTTDYGTPLDRSMVNRVIHQIVEKMNKDSEDKMEVFTPHTMRHSFATRCFENGIPPKVVQSLLGHTSIGITLDLYTHVIDETKRSEIEKINYIFKEA